MRVISCQCCALGSYSTSLCRSVARCEGNEGGGVGRDGVEWDGVEWDRMEWGRGEMEFEW